MKLKIFKQWRILLMVLCVIGSIAAIRPLPQEGVVVVSISENSTLFGKVQQGEIITWANEKEINSPEDLYQFDRFVGSFRFMHSGQLDIVEAEGKGLGIIVSKPPSTNLNLGLDLIGGTRVLLNPVGNVTDATIQQIVGTLETRINVFGLKEAKIQSINDVTGAKYVQIEMAGGTKEEVENLLAKQGKFEGKISKIIEFVNKTGKINLDETYEIKFENNSIRMGNLTLRENETSNLEGMDFQVLNLTDNNVTIMFTVLKGTDIQSVCLQDQPGICVSRIIRVGNGWQFNFQVFVTQEGAENFAKITKDMKVIRDPNTGTEYLENMISLYLDEKLITSLSIAKELKGKIFTNPAITGFRPTRDEAFKEQLMLKSILQSGSLPVSIEIIRIDEISPVLGSEFFEAALVAGAVATLIVAIVIFIRYRNFKILILMLFWSVSELILTLGAASIIKWTIDLSSIAGLIAAIGTGTNDQIVMIDEILFGGGERGAYTLKQRIKRAFFIIFGAAGTIIASMLPLMFIGVGVMKGFAIVTTIGVLIGVFITRPAFAIVAERILGEEG